MVKESPWGKPTPEYVFGSAARSETQARLAEIQDLIAQVNKELASKRQSPDYMLWRLIDAAGLISHDAKHDAIGQINYPTGRGFYIGYAMGHERV